MLYMQPRGEGEGTVRAKPGQGRSQSKEHLVPGPVGLCPRADKGGEVSISEVPCVWTRMTMDQFPTFSTQDMAPWRSRCCMAPRKVEALD